MSYKVSAPHHHNTSTKEMSGPYAKESDKKMRVDKKGNPVDPRIVLDPDCEEANELHRILQKKTINNMENAQRELLRIKNIKFLKVIKEQTAAFTLTDRLGKAHAKKFLKKDDIELNYRNFESIFDAQVRDLQAKYKYAFYALDNIEPNDPKEDKKNLSYFLKAVGKHANSEPVFHYMKTEPPSRRSAKRWRDFVRNPDQGADRLAIKVGNLIEERALIIRTEERKRKAEKKARKEALNAERWEERKRKLANAPGTTLNGLINGSRWAGRKLLGGIVMTAGGIAMGAQWISKPPRNAIHFIQEWSEHGEEWHANTSQAINYRDEIISSLRERFDPEDSSLKGIMYRNYFGSLIQKLKKLNAPLLIPSSERGNKIRAKSEELERNIQDDLESIDRKITQLTSLYLDEAEDLSLEGAKSFEECLLTELRPSKNDGLSKEYDSFPSTKAAFEGNPIGCINQLKELAKLDKNYRLDQQMRNSYTDALSIDIQDFADAWRAIELVSSFSNKKQPDHYPTSEKLDALLSWCKSSCTEHEENVQTIIDELNGLTEPLSMQVQKEWHERLETPSLLYKTMKTCIKNHSSLSLQDGAKVYVEFLRKEQGETIEYLIFSRLIDKYPGSPSCYFRQPWNLGHKTKHFEEPWIDPKIGQLLELPATNSMEDLLQIHDRFPRELGHLHQTILEMIPLPPTDLDHLNDKKKPEWLGVTENEVKQREALFREQFAQIDSRIANMKNEILAAHRHPLIIDLVERRFFNIDKTSQTFPAKAYLQAVWLVENFQNELDDAYRAFIKLTTKKHKKKLSKKQQTERFNSWETVLAGKEKTASPVWNKEPPHLGKINVPEIKEYHKQIQHVLLEIKSEPNQYKSSWVFDDFMDEVESNRGRRFDRHLSLKKFPKFWESHLKSKSSNSKPQDENVEAFHAFHRLIVKQKTQEIAHRTHAPLKVPHEPENEIVRFESSNAFEHFKSLYQKWPDKMGHFWDLTTFKEALETKGKLTVDCVLCFNPYKLKLYRTPLPRTIKYFAPNTVMLREEEVLDQIQDKYPINDTGYFFWPKEPYMRLTCGHDACRKCIEKLFKLNVVENMKKLATEKPSEDEEFKGKFECPTCREKIPFDILNKKKYAERFPFVKNLSSLRINKNATKKASESYLTYLASLLDGVGYRDLIFYRYFTFFSDSGFSGIRPDTQTKIRLETHQMKAIRRLTALKDDPIALMEAGRAAFIHQLCLYLSYLGQIEIRSFRSDILKNSGSAVSNAGRIALVDQEVEEFATKLSETFESHFREFSKCKEYEIPLKLNEIMDQVTSFYASDLEKVKEKFKKLGIDKGQFDEEMKSIEEAIQTNCKKIHTYLTNDPIIDKKILNGFWKNFEAEILNDARHQLAASMNETKQVSIKVAQRIRQKYSNANIWNMLKVKLRVEPVIYERARGCYLAQEIYQLLEKKKLPKSEKKELLKKVQDLESHLKSPTLFLFNRSGHHLWELSKLHKALLIDKDALRIDQLKTESVDNITIPLIALEQPFRDALKAACSKIIELQQNINTTEVSTSETKNYQQNSFIAKKVTELKEADSILQQIIEQFPSTAEKLNKMVNKGVHLLELETELVHEMKKMSEAISPEQFCYYAKKMRSLIARIEPQDQVIVEMSLPEIIQSLESKKKKDHINAFYQLILFFRSNKKIDRSEEAQIANALQLARKTPPFFIDEEELVDAACRAFLSSSLDTMITYGSSLMPLQPVVHPGFMNYGNTCYLNGILITLGQDEIIRYLAQQDSPLAKNFHAALLARTFGFYMNQTLQTLVRSLENFFKGKDIDPHLQQDPADVLRYLSEELGLNNDDSPLRINTKWRVQYPDHVEYRDDPDFIHRIEDLELDIATTLQNSMLYDGEGDEGKSSQLISETREFILFQIKRWDQIKVGNRYRTKKIHTNIEVNSRLDISKFKDIVTQSYEGGVYEPVVVVSHDGNSPHAGHYVANDRGMLIDDHFEPRKLDTQLEPYLVLYRRKD